MEIVTTLERLNQLVPRGTRLSFIGSVTLYRNGIDPKRSPWGIKIIPRQILIRAPPTRPFGDFWYKPRFVEHTSEGHSALRLSAAV